GLFLLLIVQAVPQLEGRVLGRRGHGGPAEHQDQRRHQHQATQRKQSSHGRISSVKVACSPWNIVARGGRPCKRRRGGDRQTKRQGGTDSAGVEEIPTPNAISPAL